MVHRSRLLEELIVYLRLARASRERMEIPVADKYLVIAGVAAWTLGVPSIPALCRQMILGHNPGHRLGRFPDFGAALQDPDFQSLLQRLVSKHPPDEAALQLARMSQVFTWNREDFASDTAYAAAALGLDPQWVEEHFSEN